MVLPLSSAARVPSVVKEKYGSENEAASGFETCGPDIIWKSRGCQRTFAQSKGFSKATPRQASPRVAQPARRLIENYES